ncbi:hypothetical protein H8B02_11745 [Bradyrhizobium sp. Pear77]|uniref:hypothetical protein n=1 Tax=Bradyrhizobium altum TaxID=1571202 RepID=UPI001E5F3DEA|nr:hypothetical protein [Bradyrhizobium altum]MCC8954109.1 hypothetical protein [Bradyrhizobium altum]
MASILVGADPANWLETAFGLSGEAEPHAPPPPKPRRVKPEVKGFVCVVKQPTGAPGDLGETADAWYYVEHDTVFLCDERGSPLTKSDDSAVSLAATLAPDDDPRAVAYRMRRRLWAAENDRSAFNRPIYQDAAPYGGY